MSNDYLGTVEFRTICAPFLYVSDDVAFFIDGIVNSCTGLCKEMSAKLHELATELSADFTQSSQGFLHNPVDPGRRGAFALRMSISFLMVNRACSSSLFVAPSEIKCSKSENCAFLSILSREIKKQ